MGKILITVLAAAAIWPCAVTATGGPAHTVLVKDGTTDGVLEQAVEDLGRVDGRDILSPDPIQERARRMMDAIPPYTGCRTPERAWIPPLQPPT